MAALSGFSAICLMGPTASGKTALAVQLVEVLPLEIISVDSAMVYRGLDIGTAKPGAETLRRAPHRLLDIREPEQNYSAGDFVRDAEVEMARIRDAGRVPLLVGGTMMYFRALTRGIARLPSADPELRRSIDREAAARGWPDLHRELATVDPTAAARIEPNDRQRIQRALEVYRASGRPLSDWHQVETRLRRPSPFLKLGLLPEPRAELHERIERRLESMLEQGFVEEVAELRQRPGLGSDTPSMRAVGYRQIWRYLDGECRWAEARAAVLAATRQLAKRQLTWLRAEPELRSANPLEATLFASISSRVKRLLDET